MHSTRLEKKLNLLLQSSLMTNPTNPNYAMMAGVMNEIKSLRELIFG